MKYSRKYEGETQKAMKLGYFPWHNGSPAWELVESNGLAGRAIIQWTSSTV
jgi:hypothetical protein